MGKKVGTSRAIRGSAHQMATIAVIGTPRSTSICCYLLLLAQTGFRISAARLISGKCCSIIVHAASRGTTTPQVHRARCQRSGARRPCCPRLSLLLVSTAGSSARNKDLHVCHCRAPACQVCWCECYLSRVMVLHTCSQSYHVRLYYDIDPR